MGRDGIFLGRDCHFLGRVGNLITWDELVTFLGRDGHRLTNLANLKYWGMHFVIIGGDGVQLLGGDIYPPSPPVSAPLPTVLLFFRKSAGHSVIISYKGIRFWP